MSFVKIYLCRSQFGRRSGRRGASGVERGSTRHDERKWTARTGVYRCARGRLAGVCATSVWAGQRHRGRTRRQWPVPWLVCWRGRAGVVIAGRSDAPSE